MKDRPLNKQAIAGLIIIFLSFFLALAILDYNVMHRTYEEWPATLYRYWLSLGLVVVVFASGITWVAYSLGVKSSQCPALFFTIVMLFVAGLLDMFYFMLTVFRGEPYSFDVWSAQYKLFVVTGILDSWGWREQILWSLGCLSLIALAWYLSKRYG